MTSTPTLPAPTPAPTTPSGKSPDGPSRPDRGPRGHIGWIVAGSFAAGAVAALLLALDAAVNIPEHNFLLSLRASMAQAGGVDLEVPARTDPPRPVDLS